MSMDLALSLTAPDWIVGGLTLIGSIVAGLWLGVRARAGEDSAHFFLAGRTLLWPIVGASLYATNIGAEHMVGFSGDFYRYGLRAGTVKLSTAICLGVGIFFMFPNYIKNKVFTILEFLELHYDRRARTVFFGLMLVICVMTKMAFTLYAGALVLKGLMGFPVMTTVGVVGVVVAVVTIIGGFPAVAFTDTIQAGIMLVGCTIMTAIGLHMVGGWGGLADKLGAIDMDVFRGITGDTARYYSGP